MMNHNSLAPLARGARALMVGAALFSAPIAIASAEEYPNRPLRLIAPFTAGSGTDAAARLLADGLTRKLGQPVVVENRPGANTAIGSALAAKSATDGYTLVMIFVDNMSLNPAIKSDLGYKPSDFDPVAIVGQIPLVLLGSPQLPYSNINELKAAALQGKKTYSFGTWGNGSVAHVVGVMLNEKGLFDFNYIPYAGSAPATNAVMGGHVDLAISTSATAETLLGSGKAKALAVGSPQRLPSLPGVPTLAESGFGNVQAIQWHGLAVRAGGDPAIIGRLQDAVAAIYAEPESRERFLKLGYMEVGGMTAAQFKTFIKTTSPTWANAVKAGHITAD